MNTNINDRSQINEFDFTASSLKPTQENKKRQGRRADDPIVKSKRHALGVYDKLVSIKNNIEESIEFPYYDGRFKMEEHSIAEDQLSIYRNVSMRAKLATEIASLKVIKSQLSLNKRKNKGELTHSQRTAVSLNNESLSFLTKSFDRMAPIGMRPEEHSLRDIKKTPGQPPLPLDVQYFMVKNDLTNSLMKVNDLLYQENMEPATIEKIVEERHKLSTTAGRRKQSESVLNVEKIDKEFNRFQEQYTSTLLEEDRSLEDHKSGRKPLSKSDKLKMYKEKMKSKKEELEVAESKLRGADLICRRKHVLEKTKRKAKKDSDINLMKELEVKIIKITAILIEAESVRETKSEQLIHEFAEQAVEGIIDNKPYRKLISLYSKSKSKTAKTSKPTAKAITNKIIAQVSDLENGDIDESMLEACLLIAEL